MVVEVTYQTKKDFADPHSHVKRTEYFETGAMPDKPTIIKKLSDMHKDFAEDSISISEYDGDPDAMRRSGLRVTKL
jgi:hypothetical protein